MISEDHVTLKTDADNTALITEINNSLTHIKIEISYCKSDIITAFAAVQRAAESYERCNIVSMSSSRPAAVDADGVSHQLSSGKID